MAKKSSESVRVEEWVEISIGQAGSNKTIKGPAGDR
jgi:hypothetical protein